MKTLLFCALSLVALPATAQRAPLAIQGNLGTTGAIGGNVGVGAEWSFHEHASATFALGRTMDDANSAEYFPVDFAAGVRAYPFREWLYAELAYGFVGTTHDYDLFSRPEVSEKERSFSYAVGVRTPAWHGVYAGVSLGRAFGDENRWLYDEGPLSRTGFALGVELGR
jgi:hypothetical protein